MLLDLSQQDKSTRGTEGCHRTCWPRDGVIRTHQRLTTTGTKIPRRRPHRFPPPPFSQLPNATQTARLAAVSTSAVAAARLLPRTFAADFTGADKVALVPRQDDGRLWLGLSEEEAELRSAVETSPVGHREDQDAHVALQCGQVLDVQNTKNHKHSVSARHSALIKHQRGEAQISSDY